MIVGHQKQWQFLKKSAELQKVPHGLLFFGQEQLGKKTLAIEFTKFLNCQSKNSLTKPCQICRDCQDIKKGLHPDFILLEPKSPHGEIRIVQIRELIQKLALRPYRADFKVAILDNAHLMTRHSQSCFLKLLEEPKGRAILILITEHPEMLLPTILSRVQKIRFSPPETTEIEKHLIKQGASKEKAKRLTSLSFGKPGAAIDFLLDSQKFENQKKLISDLIKLSDSNLSSRFQYAKDLSQKASGDSGLRLKEILDTWLGCFRKILLLRIKEKKNLGKKASLPSLLEKYPLTKLKNLISLIQSLNLLVSTTNINPRLALEILLIKL